MSRFVFTLITALAMAATAAAQAATWQIDPNHTAAQFSVRHLGVSTVRGAFTKVSGSAKYDPADPSKDSLEATIDASSVDTRVEMRDNDLRVRTSSTCRNIRPLRFIPSQTKVAGPGKLQITGDLTIHGVTKEVVLDVDGPSAPIKDPRRAAHRRIGDDQNQAAGFRRYCRFRRRRRRDHDHDRRRNDSTAAGEVRQGSG